MKQIKTKKSLTICIGVLCGLCITFDTHIQGFRFGGAMRGRTAAPRFQSRYTRGGNTLNITRTHRPLGRWGTAVVAGGLIGAGIATAHKNPICQQWTTDQYGRNYCSLYVYN